MDNNELTHWGIKGMRWGVRRYQTKDGKLTPAGKKRYDKDVEKLKAENAKLDAKLKTKKAQDKATGVIQKLQAERERKKRELETGIPDDSENREAAKLQAIKSGSAKDALKFKGELTPQEMQYIENRLRWEKNMADITDKEVSAGKARADKFFKGVDDVTGKVNTAAKAWNTFANIYNAFGGKDVSLPKIDTNITSGNKDTRKKEKKEKQKADEAKQKREEQESQRESKRQERAEKRAAKEAAKENKTYSGTVEGVGSSSRAKNETRGKSYYDDIIDAEWRDVTPSNLPTTYRSAGESYVSGLLEDMR